MTNPSHVLYVFTILLLSLNRFSTSAQRELGNNRNRQRLLVDKRIQDNRELFTSPPKTVTRELFTDPGYGGIRNRELIYISPPNDRNRELIYISPPNDRNRELIYISPPNDRNRELVYISPPQSPKRQLISIPISRELIGIGSLHDRQLIGVNTPSRQLIGVNTPSRQLIGIGSLHDRELIGIGSLHDRQLDYINQRRRRLILV